MGVRSRPCFEISKCNEEEKSSKSDLNGVIKLGEGRQAVRRCGGAGWRGGNCPPCVYIYVHIVPLSIHE